MMATVLRGASVFGAASESGAGFAKMSSNNAKRGASGLAGIQWDGDEPFGDNREIECSPADAVRSNQGAAVAFHKARSAQKRARRRDLREQFRPGCGPIASGMRFGEKHAVRGVIQSREDVFKEVHRELKNLAARSRGCRALVGFDQPLEVSTERRKILFPTVDARAHREFRIALMHGALEEYSHASHGLQITHHRAPNVVAYAIF